MLMLGASLREGRLRGALKLGASERDGRLRLICGASERGVGMVILWPLSRPREGVEAMRGASTGDSYRGVSGAGVRSGAVIRCDGASKRGVVMRGAGVEVRLCDDAFCRVVAEGMRSI